MKRGVLFALCTTAALAAPAVAQDTFAWTGFFAGINSGYASGNGDGFIGGAQAGYDYLLPSGWLIGVETDIQGTTINPAIHSTGTFGPAGSFSLNYSSSLDYVGTARLRLGYLLGQNVLLYATSGLAYGNVKASTDIRLLQGSVPTTASLSRSALDVGWIAGGGVEFPLTERLKLRGEYLYTDLGAYSEQKALTGASSGMASMSGNTTAHIGRIALSYAF